MRFKREIKKLVKQNQHAETLPLVATHAQRLDCAVAVRQLGQRVEEHLNNLPRQFQIGRLGAKMLLRIERLRDIADELHGESFLTEAGDVKRVIERALQRLNDIP